MASTKLQKHLWYQKNRDRLLKKRRDYYIQNKESILLKDKEYYPIANKLRKERRHRLGISKRYRGEFLGISQTKIYNIKDRKEYNKLWKQTPRGKLSKKRNNQAYRRRIKMGGKITVKDVQLVYEDNIKKYGTLTCYLCLKSIEFGKDHLEHKIPLSRGGSNKYENLEVSCQECNCKKHDKTDEEYRKILI